jgi:plasmid stabilization system protein ParE
MADLAITAAAKAELEEARAYYRRESLLAADGFVTDVQDALELIGDDPELWPSDEDDERYRFFVLKKHSYVIYYRMVSRQNVRIVAIVHSSRSPGSWRGR